LRKKGKREKMTMPMFPKSDMKLQRIKEIHDERIKALDKAYKAIEDVNNMILSTFIFHALENIRLAKVEEEVCFKSRIANIYDSERE